MKRVTSVVALLAIVGLSAGTAFGQATKPGTCGNTVPDDQNVDFHSVQATPTSQVALTWELDPADGAFEFHRVDIAVGKMDPEVKKVASVAFTCVASTEVVIANDWKDTKPGDDDPWADYEIWSAVFVTKCTGAVVAVIVSADPEGNPDPTIKSAWVSKGWDRWTCAPDHLAQGYQRIDIFVGNPAATPKKLAEVAFVCAANGLEIPGLNKGKIDPPISPWLGTENWSADFLDKCPGKVDVYLLSAEKGNHAEIKKVTFTNHDVPAVSEWGLAVMGLLVLTAGTVVVMRRRAIVMA